MNSAYRASNLNSNAMAQSTFLIELSTPGSQTDSRQLYSDFTPSLTNTVPTKCRQSVKTRTNERSHFSQFQPISRKSAEKPGQRQASMPLTKSSLTDENHTLPAIRTSLKRPLSTPSTPRAEKLSQRRRIALKDKSNASPEKTIGNKSLLKETPTEKFVDIRKVVKSTPESVKIRPTTDSDLKFSYVCPSIVREELINSKVCSCERPSINQFCLQKDYDARLYRFEIQEWKDVVEFLELERKFGI